MASQTPQIQSLNPKPYKNPQRCPSENNRPNNNQLKKAAETMEKLKEAIMKMSRMATNNPLSEAHIEYRLNQLLSSLLHTPDHPPYAWMIERAIRELNEKGGSSEESISTFIRKEYDDLPWAHSTILNHHLANLSESGEVILTEGKRYLLADADSTSNTSKKCRRKPARRKRGYDWEKKRSKQGKKNDGRESLQHKEDEVELIDEQRHSHEQEKQMIAGEDVVIDKASAQSTVPANLLIEDTNKSPSKFKVPQKGSESVFGERIDICLLDAELEQDEEQLECDQSQPLTPERPPGFEFVAREELYHPQTCSTRDSSRGAHANVFGKQADPLSLANNVEQLDILKRPPELAVLAPEGLLGDKEQIPVCGDHNQLRQVVRQSLEETTTKHLVEPKEYEQRLTSEAPSVEGLMPFQQADKEKVTLGEGTQANNEEEKVFLSSYLAEKTLQELQEPQPVTTTNSIDLQLLEYHGLPADLAEAGPRELSGQQKLPEPELTTNTTPSETKPSCLSGVKQVPSIVFQYRKRPPSLGVTKDKQLSCTLEQTKEEELQERQSTYQGQKNSDKSPTASSMLCLLQHQQQEIKLSLTNQLQEVQSGAANRLEHQEQQELEKLKEHPIFEESHQGLEASAVKQSYEQHHQHEEYCGVSETPKLQNSMVIPPKLRSHPKQLNQGDENRPTEPESVVIEELLPTERMQSQQKRWSKRLLNLKRPQREDPASVDSTQVTDTEPKVRGRRKRNAEQREIALDSSVALQHVHSDELSKLPNSDSCPEQEQQIESSKHQQEKQVSQEKPPSRVLRSQSRKPEVSNALITSDFSPSVHHHQEQQEPKYHCRGRTPKAKPDPRLTVELGSLILPDQQDRNQPAKEPNHEPSIGATVSKLLPKFQEEEQHQLELQSQGSPPKSEVQQSESRRRGRPPKPKGQESELRRRGRPPIPKPVTSILGESTTSNDQDQHEDDHAEKPKTRGRGRHPESKAVANRRRGRPQKT